MKKILTICLSVAMIILCLGAVGCNRVKGEYKLKQIEIENAIYAVGSEYQGTILTEDFISFNFAKDGTFTGKLFGEDIKGTWENEKGEDDSILVTFEKATTRMEIDDRTLEWDIAGMEIILVKA